MKESSKDLIVPWREVRPGDLALSGGGGFMLVDEIRVLQQSDEHPDFLIAHAYGRHAENDGTVTGRRVHVSPNAATLTAVRRAAEAAAESGGQFPVPEPPGLRAALEHTHAVWSRQGADDLGDEAARGASEAFDQCAIELACILDQYPAPQAATEMASAAPGLAALREQLDGARAALRAILSDDTGDYADIAEHALRNLGDDL